MLRSFAPAKSWMQRQSKKRGAKKAHAILEAKIGRAVYHLWKKQVAFDAPEVPGVVSDKAASPRPVSDTALSLTTREEGGPAPGGVDMVG